MNGILSSRYLPLLLVLTSLLLYGINYLVFGGGDGIAAGFLANLAFLPLYVLFVTLIIEGVLKERDRQAIRQKLNMVIGAFFSEVGTAMIRDGISFVEDEQELVSLLGVSLHWTPADFKRATDYLEDRPIDVDSRQGGLPALKEFLIEKRRFMLSLLANPNLLEHDEFTDLLWAVLHLTE